MKEHNPIEINLHKKSHLLEITFDTGENYKLSCEYLRTHAKSAEVKASELPVAEKIDVNIDSIEPQGSYALRLFFDDGFDQGIYSWETFYDLGKNYEQYWASYLSALEQYQLTRGVQAKNHTGKHQVKLLYFMDKLIKFTTEDEIFELPDNVRTVQDLLAQLRERGNRWQRAFADDAIQFTVNKEFAELFTVLEHGDEVALIPKST
ncbi:MAG: gamma-butyrobetaine hydroxylase-like domain-containing protein [Gammaproteobacteria bacterium]|nr:gamma-butyrobetaine hydroxylase-like domain-containing protein [Gammaproteobacteria bacterium]